MPERVQNVGLIGDPPWPGELVELVYVQKEPTWAMSTTRNATRVHLIRERVRFTMWKGGNWNTRWWCGSVATRGIRMVLGEPKSTELCDKCLVNWMKSKENPE